MVQIVEQTYDEKMAMYMKLPKKQLVEMLIECNRIIGLITPNVYCGDEAVTKINHPFVTYSEEKTDHS